MPTEDITGPTKFEIAEGTEVKLNFMSTRSHVIRAVEFSLLKMVLELSAQLSVAAVADFFEHEAVWGEPGDCERCIVAEWVHDKITANIDGYKFRVDSVSVSQDCISASVIGEGDWRYDIQIPVPTDSPLSRFIVAFDEGAFPDLTMDAYRALAAEIDKEDGI